MQGLKIKQKKIMREEKCNYPVNCKPVMKSLSWVYSTL